MGQREALHQVLVDLLGSPQVYFQPPANVDMQYPCIVYARDNVDIVHADNAPYLTATRYMITYIDREPDSDVPGKLAMLPMSSFSRFYVADNLNHDVYTLYY